MFSRIIENYINNLTKKDIIDFSNKENIILDNSELDYIYKIIKTEYKTILYDDSTDIFNNIKSRINPTSYNKIKKLFDSYKEKYKKYL